MQMIETGRAFSGIAQQLAFYNLLILRHNPTAYMQIVAVVTTGRRATGFARAKVTKFDQRIGETRINTGDFNTTVSNGKKRSSDGCGNVYATMEIIAITFRGKRPWAECS